MNGRFVCEALPAQKLPFTGADPAELQAHLDGNHEHEKSLKGTITRISRSAAAILPSEASTSVPTEKSQLRDYCYAASVTDETNVTEQASELSDCVAALPDSPEILPETDAGSKPTSPSNVQELLNFLFGEESI